MELYGNGLTLFRESGKETELRKRGRKLNNVGYLCHVCGDLVSELLVDKQWWCRRAGEQELLLL